MIKQLLIFTCFVFTMGSMVIATPTNHIVTNTNDTGAGSFRQALADAVNGDSITVADSLSSDTLHLISGQLEITSSVKIYGNGLTIDADSLSRVLYMSTLDSVLIDNLGVTGGGLVDKGAGIYAYNITALNIQHSTILGNTTVSSPPHFSEGGGIYVFAINSSVLLYKNVISGNKAYSSNFNSQGGGVFSRAENNSLVIFSENIISLNSANSTTNNAFGGGVYSHVSTNSSMEFSSNVVAKNIVLSTNSHGGGISSAVYYSSSVVYDKNKIVENTVISTSSLSSGGGGVHALSTSSESFIMYSNNTISSNTASSPSSSSYGGGINVTSSSLVEFYNNTISDNIASSSNFSSGGGIYTSANSVTLQSNTIANNEAFSSTAKSFGGGVYAFVSSVSDSLSIGGNIIAGNEAETGKDLRNFGDGIINTLGYNLIGNNLDVSTLFPAGTPNSNNDIVGVNGNEVDPLLSPLADNGGPTLTMALQAGSPAIDMGHPDSINLDQRGYRVNGRKDIGAFEFGGFVGLKDLPQVNMFDAYPNPTVGIVQLKSVNQMDYVIVMNSFGQTVLEQKVQGKAITFDLSDEAIGLYFIQVRSGKNTAVKRLLKN